MAPKTYKVVHEAADRFHVQDEHGQFPIAKKGLSPALIKRIQGFAKGGEVLGAAEGGELTQDDALVQPSYPTNAPGGSTWWDKAKDFAGNVGQTYADTMKDSARAMVAGPLMINNALSDPNVKALAPDGVAQSIGQGINAAGHALLPNLVAEQKPGAAEPKESFAARQPPPTAAPYAGQSAGSAPIGAGGPSAYSKGQLAAGEAEKAAQGQLAQVATDEATKKGEVLQAEDRAMADAVSQRKGMEAEYQAHYQREMDDYRNLTNKFARTEIDPNRFYASRSTGDKMLGAIGMVLGAVGQALGGGPNQTVDILNGAIARDIDAQKANLAKTGQAAGMQQNLLGMMREKYKDESMAQAATEAAMLQRAKVQLEEISARAAGPEAQARLALFKPQLDAALAEKNLTVEMKVKANAAEVAERWAHARKLGAASTASNPAQAAMAAVAGLEAKYKQGHFTSPLEYEDARESTALQLATAQNGGKLPRPASVEMIKKTLPTWYQLEGRAGAKFKNARTTVRLGAKVPPSGGGDGGGDDEDVES